MLLCMIFASFTLSHEPLRLTSSYRTRCICRTELDQTELTSGKPKKTKKTSTNFARGTEELATCLQGVVIRLGRAFDYIKYVCTSVVPAKIDANTSPHHYGYVRNSYSMVSIHLWKLNKNSNISYQGTTNSSQG